jgi:hypothetical protein
MKLASQVRRPTCENEVNMVKIRIALSEENLAGAEAEWVWVEPQGDGTYVLKNAPFYANELSCEDIVRAEPEEGHLAFKGVVRRGGHSTYRIYANVGRTTPDVIALLETLQSMPCDIERATDKLVGVDVLPEADVYKVYEILAESERAGIIDFQEGHCGHPLRI